MLEKAIAARAELFDARHESAVRLFNGFYEGDAGIAVDLYARTAVIHDYAALPDQSENTTAEITHSPALAQDHSFKDSQQFQS